VCVVNSVMLPTSRTGSFPMVSRLPAHANLIEDGTAPTRPPGSRRAGNERSDDTGEHH